MIFNSIDFLLFFPIVVVLYFLLPQRIKWMWLLACSVYFYMFWKAKYIILIGFSIFVTYLGSLLIEKWRTHKNLARLILALVLFANLGVLFLFKYYNFFLSLFPTLSEARALPLLQFALPVGISFYTFQALGYSIDVYRGTVTCEKNLFRYALFICFFPQLVAGPIERSQHLLPQFYERHYFDYDRVKSGLLLMGWGFFQKLVIADRLAIFVNGVYDSYSIADGAILSLATVFFAFQIYCDFSSYTNIARGAAEILGFNLMENFHAPYFAQSIKDFWRRWHISLSTWFKDYLYIPLGGSRKGLIITCVNIFVVFVVSGLWHGAALTFLIWGILHGLYQIIETIIRKVVKPSNSPSLLRKSVHILFTFVLVDLTWVFFRASNLTQAVSILKSIITDTNLATLTFSNILSFGMDRPDFIVSCVGLSVLLCVDLLTQHCNLRQIVLKQSLWRQWLLYFLLIISITVFGVYGPEYTATPFIYFQF